MPSEPDREHSSWAWVLKCRRCSRVADFDDVCVPTTRLVEWARCCGEMMELESVERSADDA